MKYIFIFLQLIVVYPLWAQDKTLTIQEAIAGYNLYPRGPSQLQWLPSGEYFSKISKTDDGVFLEVQQIESTGLGITSTLSFEDFKTACKDMVPAENLKSFPAVSWKNDGEFLFKINSKQYLFHFQEKKCSLLWELPKYEDIVFTKSKEACAVSDGKTITLITNDNKLEINHGKRDGIVIGQAVHRHEFGINGGLFWSPTNEKLAYYVMDESMVTQFPLYNLSDTPATADMVRYPTAGGTSHIVSLYVTDWNGNIIRIKTKENSDHYLTNIAWTPDGTKILIAEVTRNQKEMYLNMYDAQTGDFIKTLFTEKNNRYVEPENPALFLRDESDKFIWQSERDGFNHLYVYNLEGRLLKQITAGNWVVTQIHGFDKKGNVFISGTKESPLERHFYCVSTKNGKMKKLTDKSGTHSIQLNYNGNLFIDRFTSTDVALEITLNGEKGGYIDLIDKVDNPLIDYKLGEMTIDKLKSEDGHDLYYRVFKPIDFDPDKKYPVVVYLYNGPHLQLINNRWLGGANLWYQYMAQQGYVVFSIDGRGSDNRGFEFESAIHKQCGQNEMKDQLVGVNWLKKQSWVDTNRMGVHGWSYGGFMTTSLMTHYPGVFKVGVAGGPVIDWSLYEIMYTERYMESPPSNPEGYELTNLKNRVQDLEGKLLMIHGGLDDVVLWQHSLQYLQEAIKKKVQLDYFVYPHHKHNVSGIDRVHLYEKISNYFFQNL
jgi:dipeptidyl-peptidase-4